MSTENDEFSSARLQRIDSLLAEISALESEIMDKQDEITKKKRLRDVLILVAGLTPEQCSDIMALPEEESLPAPAIAGTLTQEPNDFDENTTMTSKQRKR